MFDLFETVFIETIDPRTKYTRLLAFDVFVCIVINVSFYLALHYLFVKVFVLPDKTLLLLYCLIAIMVLGYIARLARSKSVYNVYRHKGYSAGDAYQQTIRDMHGAYFTW
jgi:hypothetical protein